MTFNIENLSLLTPDFQHREPFPPDPLLAGVVELALVESQYMDAIPMNHVIHHIETPPGLTPPRLLAGGREGKVLYVESQYYVIYEPRDSRY